MAISQPDNIKLMEKKNVIKNMFFLQESDHIFTISHLNQICFSFASCKEMQEVCVYAKAYMTYLLRITNPNKMSEKIYLVAIQKWEVSFILILIYFSIFIIK